MENLQTQTPYTDILRETQQEELYIAKSTPRSVRKDLKNGEREK